jgi:hypothetical protein
MVETASTLFGRRAEAAEALRLCSLIPEYPDPEFKTAVEAVRTEAATAIPDLVWLADGRDLWELFNEENFIANTRFDLCSKTMKREVGDRFVKGNFKPDEVTLYFGIDHGERHRFYGTDNKPGIRRLWLPYVAEAPLCDPPYLTKCEMLQECERDEIDPPRIYDEGFPHNNCGGFCVKAGHTQFLHLLRARPHLFAYHAQKEQEFRERVGKDVSIMRDRRGGTTKPLPMLEFQRQVESGERVVGKRDWGKGCQCFTPGEETVNDSEVGTVVPDHRMDGGGLPGGEGVAP